MACITPGVLSRFEDLAEAAIDPPHLRAIRNWKNSDCGSEDRRPTAEMAPNWSGTGRCGSCAACRPEQRMPRGDWDTWLYLAGRGAGKTRSAAEVVAEAAVTNRKWRIAVLAPTFGDGRDICIEGESGLISVLERWGWLDGKGYTWNRSIGELTIHSTRSKIKLFSAEKPARLRGPQHHLVWVEELAQVVKYAPDAWDMAQFGLRLGKRPRSIATTTPLPVALIKELIADPMCAVTRGATDDNAANLPPSVLRKLHKKYDGTRLGRQELGGELLDDIPGALWKREWLDRDRITIGNDEATFDDEHHVRNLDRLTAVHTVLAELGVTLVQVIVAVDPAVTSGEDADETGIVVVGKGDDHKLYVLDDCSLRDTPSNVMARVIAAHDLYEANEVIVEVNNGGEYIPDMLKASLKLRGRRGTSIPCKSIHAKKGKRVRAEPASAQYEQRNVRHVGTHKHLEDQVCVWTPEQIESPDRMDALVYGVLFLADITTGSTLVAPKGSIPRHRQGRARTQMPTSSVRRTA